MKTYEVQCPVCDSKIVRTCEIGDEITCPNCNDNFVFSTRHVVYDYKNTSNTFTKKNVPEKSFIAGLLLFLCWVSIIGSVPLFLVNGYESSISLFILGIIFGALHVIIKICLRIESNQFDIFDKIK